MAERFSTLFALMWFFPGVSSLMLSKGDFLAEGFPTLFTLIGPLSCVCLLMVPESRLPAVGPPTLGTFIRSLPYGSLMGKAAGAFVDCTLVFVTLVVTLLCVRPLLLTAV